MERYTNMNPANLYWNRMLDYKSWAIASPTHQNDDLGRLAPLRTLQRPTQKRSFFPDLQIFFKFTGFLDKVMKNVIWKFQEISMSGSWDMEHQIRPPPRFYYVNSKIFETFISSKLTLKNRPKLVGGWNYIRTWILRPAWYTPEDEVSRKQLTQNARSCPRT